MALNIFSGDSVQPLGAVKRQQASSDPKALLDGIAARHQVPANVIVALAEAGGIDSLDKIEALAQEAGLAAKSGKGFDAILRERGGDALLNRAYDIADQIEPAAAKAPEKPSMVKDAALGAASALTRGLGGAADYLGRTVDRAAEAGFGGAYRALTGAKGEITPLESLGATGLAREGLNGIGDSIASGISPEAQQAAQDAMPTGDITDPSTWQAPKDLSLRGLVQVAAQGIGSLAPVVVAGLVSKNPGVAAGVMGGAMAGGDGRQTAGQLIDQLNNEKGPEGLPRLASESDLYQQLVKSGATPEQAYLETKKRAMDTAGDLQALIGGAGGAVTGGLVAKGLPESLAGQSIAGNVARGVVASGIEEGAQEAAETMAARAGVNSAAGTNLNIGEGTLEAAAAGALAGGPFGALGAVPRKGNAPPPEGGANPQPPAPILALPAPDPTPGLPSPTNGGTIIGSGPTSDPASFERQPDDYRSPGAVAQQPAQFRNTGTDGSGAGAAAAPQSPPLDPSAGGGAAATLPPAGPIEAIARLAPDMTPAPEAPAPEPMFPDQKPGAKLRLYDPETDMVLDGVFQREIPGGGAVVRIDGGELELDAQTFDRSLTEAARRDQALKAPKPASGSLSQKALAVVPKEPPRNTEPPQSAEQLAAAISAIEMKAASDGWTPGLMKRRDKMRAQLDALSVDPETGEILPAAKMDANGPQQPANAPIGLPSPADAGTDAAVQPERGAEGAQVPAAGRDAGSERPAGIGAAESLDAAVAPGEPAPALSEGPASRVVGEDPVERARQETQQRLARLAEIEAGLTEQQRATVKRIVDQAEEMDRWAARRGALSAFAGEADPLLQPSSKNDTRAFRAAQKAAQKQEAQPAPALSEAPAAPKATISDIRERAAVLRGWPKDTPPVVEGVSLKWDEKDGGFVFSRKHRDAVQAAIAGGAPIAESQAQPATVADSLSDDTAVKEQEQAAATPAAAQIEAAAAETNPEPTPAQAEAENYKTGKTDWQGLKLSIENKKGGTRRKVGKDGATLWEVTMPAHYGRILGTKGADGDHVDFYMGDNPDSPSAWVIDQVDADTGRFDEHKVMLGFDTPAQAKATYLAGFSDGKGKDRLSGIRKMTTAELTDWLQNGDTTKPVTGKTKATAKVAKAPAKQNPVNEKTEPQQSVPGEAAPISRDEQSPAAASNAPAKAPAKAPARPKPNRIEQFRTSYAQGSADGMRENPDLADVAAYADWLGGLSEAQWKAMGGVFDASHNPFLNPAAIDIEARRGELEGALAKAKPPTAPKQAATTAYGANNTFVTAEQAEKARALIRAKLKNQINSGIDPDLLAAGIQIAAFHIEAGARRFGQAARAIADDLGMTVDQIRPYLRGWYNGARDTMQDSGLSIEGMDDAETVARELGIMAAAKVDLPAVQEDSGSVATQRLSSRDVSGITTDAKTFQYKDNGDESGVTERLQGVTDWDEVSAMGGMVYQYADGRMVVADGHQRLGLAKRLQANGVQTPWTVAIYRQADGFTPEQVRQLAALKNIREGSGTAIDAAKVLRATPNHPGVMNLPPKSALVRDARALAKLSDDAFGMVINEIATIGQGVAVGSKVADQKAQKDVLSLLVKLKPANQRQAEMIAEQAAAETTTEVQTSLFGDEEVAESLYLERAKVLDNALSRIRQDRATFKVLADRAGTIAEEGNVLNQEANARRVANDAKVQAYLTAEANRKGPISDALSAAARKLKAEPRSLSRITDGFLQAIREPREDAGRTGPDGATDDRAGGAAESLRQEARDTGVERDPAQDSDWGDQTLSLFGDDPAPAPAVASQGAAPAVRTVSPDTFRNWKKSLPSTGAVRGWTVFDDTATGGAWVLMSLDLMASPFASEADARSWAGENPEASAGPEDRQIQYPTTLEKIAQKPQPGQGRLTHIYAEYQGARYYIGAVTGNADGPAAEWRKTYPQAAIYTTDRADGTSINGQINELDQAVAAAEPAEWWAQISREDEGRGAIALLERAGVGFDRRGRPWRDIRADDQEKILSARDEGAADQQTSFEPGADGLAQAIIPGAEQSESQRLQQIADAKQREAEARMAQSKMRRGDQKRIEDEEGGLFGEPKRDLFDMPAPPQNTAPSPDGAPKLEAPEATSQPAQKPARIEDFGEKIGGARKDVWSGFKEKMEEAEGLDVAAEPLSKSWPEPDYDKLIDAGIDPWTVSFVRAARDMIPRKPGKSWKLRGWADEVKTLRKFANDLLSSRFTKEQVQAKLAASPRLNDKLGGRISLYEAVGHSKSLKELSFGQHTYSMLNGEYFTKGKTFWEVTKEQAATAFNNMPKTLVRADTREEAIAMFKRAYGSLDASGAPQGNKGKGTKFLIYSQRGDTGAKYRVGVKIGSNHIDLRTGIADVAEARRIIAEESDQLQAQLDRMRDIPNERRDENAPRLGADHRAGADVTPQQFAETFGFRGVEFGNWVEDSRRQEDLNNAYDGLMDLASILDLQPKALSLNGSLGLAFGARGSGGKNAAAAHYEPGKVVINLTKRNGRGSLAHEWFHAMDNYFAKQRAQQRGSYITDNLAPGASPLNAGVRPELVDAFMAVRRAIMATDLKKRSENLDRMRSSPYWGTGIEMHARAFESFVIAKLQDQGAANDYLANVVDGVFWSMMAEASGIGDSYPYLKADEIEKVRPAFDKLFSTIETRETERGVEMYSRFPVREPVATLTGDELGEWEDMRQLGKKAEAWYRKNLTGQSVTNSDTGWTITFANTGAKKTTSGKGADLLRMVPALRQIMQSGKLVSTEPDAKGRDGVKAIHKFSATVQLDGRPRDVIATVREGTDGKYQYSLSRDMSDGARFMRPQGSSASVDMTGNSGPIPALEGNPVELNLQFAEPSIKPVEVASFPALSQVLAQEMRTHGLAGKISPRVVRGLVSAAGIPILGRQRGAQIEVNADAPDAVGVMRHEIIHALRDPSIWGADYGLFTQTEWQALVKAARADEAISQRVERAYADKSVAVRTEEKVAELYREWAGARDGAGQLGRIFAKVRALFRAMASGLRGEGFTDAALVMDRIASGRIGGRGPQGPGGGVSRPGMSMSDLLGRAIVPTRRASNFNEVRIVVKEFQGKPLRNADTGLVATVSRNNLDKMLSGSAAEKSSDNQLHRSAVANVDALFEVAVKGWTKADRDNDPGIKGIHRFFAPLQKDDGRIAMVKMTVKETARSADNNPLYTVEAVDEVDGPSAAMWVASAIEADAIDPKAIRSAEGVLNMAQMIDDFNSRSVESSAEMRASLMQTAAKAQGMIGSAHWKDPGVWVSNAVSNLLTDSMGAGSNWSSLALVPGRALFAELGKRLPSAQRFLKAKDAMDALRNDWQAKSAEVMEAWYDAGSKNHPAREQLHDLMHRATIAGVDPSKPDTWRHALQTAAERDVSQKGYDGAQDWARDVMDQVAARKRTHKELKAIFDTLPKEFQDIFVKARNTLNDLADDMDRAVLENVEKSIKLSIKRAQREHAKALEEIRDQGLKGAERDEAIAAADAKLLEAKKMGGFAAKAKMASLRKVFESNRLKGPYFPLARFGNYFVTVRNADGEVISFARFERAKQQEAHIKEMEALHPGRVKFGVLDQKGGLRGQVDPRFVADVEKLLMQAGADTEVMDAVWQRYLETLPDMSVRKSKIHRKGREGFYKDALRAFASHTMHGAHQLARLKHGLDLEDALDDAFDEAAKAEDPNRAKAVVNEMQRRKDWIMNPTNAAWSSKASSLAFVWYLGVSPAAALINLSQTTVIGPAVMKAKFQRASVTGIVSEIARATKEFGQGQGVSWKDTWSAENAASLNDDERAALREGYKRGTIDKTQAHDLAAVAESGVEFSPFREKWMKRIGWAFHHAERVNREVTMLAAYRLARRDGLGHDAAIEAAIDVTWRTHFSYQNSDRPRFMQDDYMKVLTQFRQYSVNLLFRLFRDAHQSLYGATKEDRAEARTQLIGISLSMFAHAGIKGVWGYGLLMMLLGMFFPGGDDDAEKWLQDALLMEGDSAGTAAWNWTMGAALNGVPGRVLGVDLSERIGMPNLWFRGDDRDLEGEDLVQGYVNEILGPTVGILFSLGRAGQNLVDGEVARGIEGAVPKFMRDILRTGRYAAEGVRTKNGDTIVEDISPLEMLWQANGFTPARIAERYEVNSRLKNAEQRIMDERKEILQAWDEAQRSGEGIPPELNEALNDFNKRYPYYPITADSIRQSIRSRQLARDNNEFGVRLNPKLNSALRESEPPTIFQ